MTLACFLEEHLYPNKNQNTKLKNNRQGHTVVVKSLRFWQFGFFCRKLLISIYLALCFNFGPTCKSTETFLGKLNSLLFGYLTWQFFFTLTKWVSLRKEDGSSNHFLFFLARMDNVEKSAHVKPQQLCNHYRQNHWGIQTGFTRNSARSRLKPFAWIFWKFLEPSLGTLTRNLWNLHLEPWSLYLELWNHLHPLLGIMTWNFGTLWKLHLELA